MHKGRGVTEGGEVVDDLPLFARDAPAHVWVVDDPVSLLLTMLERYGDVRAFSYQVLESREVDTEVVSHSTARLTRFGFKCRCTTSERKAFGCGCGCPPKRKDALHTVWSPADMARNPSEYLEDYSHKSLLKFGCDVRDWCSEQNIPLPTSLPGIAAGLLKDERFWPHDRGRVPTATNENVRKYLPGVHSELRADVGTLHRAIALDQRRAYHRAAQEVNTPDPTTLYARGFYIDPENSPLWCEPGDGVYERTMSQPGVVFVEYDARPERQHEFRPPWVQVGINRAAVYTNEVNYVEELGVTIHGIVAAWTSADADSGLPRYGAWAHNRIDEASDYRQRWLKPTLHAAYGLLAMRPRRVIVGNSRAVSPPRKFILGRAHEFVVPARELPVLTAPTTNVAMLGVLQAEIRTRSLRMASALSEEGVSILHIHADGIHVEADELPLMPNDWSVKTRTNLEYIDRVSWVSDQGDVLPGRDEAMRVELRRHRARINRVHLEVQLAQASQARAGD